MTGSLLSGLTARRLRLALLVLALIVFIGYLLIYVNYAFSLFRFPFDYDQGEGFELYDTILFSQGEWPYRDNETFPFYSSNYPPLYHLIAAPLVRIFGPEYWTGRALSFVSTLVTASLIGYAVYREGGRSRWIAALAGLAFLASNTIYHIGSLFRQHIGMVMWETLAVVLAAAWVRPGRRTSRRELAVIVAVLLAAGYTKQLAVVTCAAVFLFLFIRGPVRALAWSAIFAVLGGAIFLWMDASTGGQWWLNAVLANVNLYIPGQARDLYLQWFGLHGALIIPAGLLLLYECYFSRISVYGVWFVCAVAGGLLSGKWGAGDSYFATAIAATCVMSGIFLGRTLTGGWRFEPNYITERVRRFAPARLLQNEDARREGLRLLVPAVYLLYALAVVHMPTEGPVFGPVSRALGLHANTRYDFYDSAGWVMGYATIGHSPTDEDIEAGRRITAYFDATDAPIMSEEAGFSLAAGGQVITNPTQLRNLWASNPWDDQGRMVYDLYDPSNLVEMVRDQAFGYVIYRAQFYPQPVLDAVAGAYITKEVIQMNGFEYIILEPREQADDS